jgi:hypothetical protein
MVGMSVDGPITARALKPSFGGNHDIFSRISHGFERCSDQTLAMPNIPMVCTIDIRGVYPRHPSVDGRVDHGDSLGVIRASAQGKRHLS